MTVETMESAGLPSRGGVAARREWTKGSVAHNLWSLSWPIMVSNSFNMLGPTIDMIWVGKLGAAAIAGVGVAGMIVMLGNSLLMGLFTGLRAMIARSVGAGDARMANHVAMQAMVISAAASVIMALIGIFFAEAILGMVGVEAEVIAQGAPYLRINFVGMVAMTFRMMTDGSMQASGDTMNPMKIAVVFRLFHIVLCPFLVFGWWLFPHMGVSGAALTTVLSQGLGTAIGLWLLFTGRTQLMLTLRNFRLDPNIMWRIIKIGIPASIMGIQMSLGQFILMWFMAPFGTLAVAAHTLSQRLEWFLFVPSWGLGMAAGVLVGQNLGARQPEQAERSGWLAVVFAEGFMVICSLAILLWAESIIHLFSSEPGLVKLASTFLRIAVAGYLVMGITGVLQQCMSGAGDTLPPMIFSLVMVWVIQLPLAYFLPHITGLGAYGVRWAIVAGSLVGAVAYTIYFRLGRWKYKKV